ncbi:MAG: hypothetical protein MJ230_04520 [bacterium]|nr:hypothetical protein [bacterium]
MKPTTGYLHVGDLPYESIKSVTAMEAKLYKELPFLACLPKISVDESLKRRSFINIPGIFEDEDKIILKTGLPNYDEEMSLLNKAYNNYKTTNLEEYACEDLFLEKFCQMIKKFKPPYACVNILGPFTVSQILSTSAKEQALVDKNYKKLFTQVVCVKGFWAIDKIKEYCPDTIPIIILEEPMFNQFGMLKREDEDVTAENVTKMFEIVVSKLKSAGAMVGIQCMDKCDWSIPIKSGVDLISYDAYNNPNNLCIYPEIVTSFLQKGGLINWGIVPTVSETLVRGLSIEYLFNRLEATINGVALAGVPINLLQNSALVSLNGNTSHLPVFFAEKAIIMVAQLAGRLSTSFGFTD